MMRARLRDWLRRQAFDPDLAGMLVNPFFLARRGLARALRELSGSVTGRVLDVGCGQKPYAGLFRVTQYIGVEMDTPENRRSKRADCYFDGRTLPFGDDCFDTVLCSQVLEHVFEPEGFVAELNRVLRPGGFLLLTTPFVWDEHEQPFDYARYSSFGLRYLLGKHGLRVEAERKTLPDASVLFQLANAYLYKVTVRRGRLLNLFSTVVLMAPLSLLGVLSGKVLPRNADLYLDNVLLLRKEAAASPAVPRLLRAQAGV